MRRLPDFAHLPRYNGRDSVPPMRNSDQTTAPRKTIFVSGMIAADPHQGGATWSVLQYVLGLKALGHRVWVIEPLRPTSLRPSDAPFATSINAAYFAQVAADFDLQDSAALLLEGTRETVGVAYDD